MYLINDTLSTLLPFRIYMPDGSSRTCLNELTEADLAELNIYPVDEIRPDKLATQYYGEPTITIADGKALVEYSVLDYSEEQLAERLTAAKEAKKSEIAAARYEAEIAGILGIKTDRESQALLTGAVLQAFIDPTYSLNWKTVDGTFVELGYAEIMAVGTVVRTHVQVQFNKESEIRDKIDACTTVEEVAAITYE